MPHICYKLIKIVTAANFGLWPLMVRAPGQLPAFRYKRFPFILIGALHEDIKKKIFRSDHIRKQGRKQVIKQASKKERP